MTVGQLGPLGRLRAPDGTVSAVYIQITGRASKIRDANPPPLSSRLAGAARLDQLAAYVVSRSDETPLVAILKLAVRGQKYRPGPVACAVLDRLASSYGDPPKVADVFEQLVAASAFDAVEATASQAQQDAQRVAQRPGEVERRVVEGLGVLMDEIAHYRQMDEPPTRPATTTEYLLGGDPPEPEPPRTAEEMLDADAANRDEGEQAQKDAATTADARSTRDRRAQKVFGGTAEQVRRMFPTLDDEEFEQLLTQRAGPAEPEEQTAAVETPEGVRQRGSGYQAFWRDPEGRQKQQGGFQTAEAAAAHRKQQLEAAAAAKDS